MRIFGIGEASHYCSSFSSSPGVSQGSIDEFQKRHLVAPGRTITEGSMLFQEYRDCSLRDVERSLFFALSNYRRSFDLMIPSSSPWAHVTLYYGTWYASRALLGMFGCTVFDKYVVDVHNGSLGQQELQLRRIGNKSADQEPTTFQGSHKVFWDFFYKSVQSLVPMVKPRLAPALSPVSSDPVWQINHRNDINYDTYTGFRVVEDFESIFSPPTFPNSLPPVLYTQFHILETLLELTHSFAKKFGLRTDALDGLGRPASFPDKAYQWIYKGKRPRLVQKIKKKMFT